MASQPHVLKLPVAQGPYEPAELWVFASGEHAQSAGFHREKHRHRDQLHLRAWWPTLGIDSLRGFEFCRVVVTDYVRRQAYGDRRREEALAEGLHMARAHLRLSPKLWIDL